MSQEIYIILCLLVSGIFYIATSSIAIQCYNQQTPPVTGTNYYFVIFNLISAILVVLSAIIAMYMYLTGKL